MAYALVKGDPGKHHVLHTCDNTLCVRPSHLFLGNHAANMADMRTKGRAKDPTALNAAKTHCKRGHPLSGANLYVKSNGQRQCRRCRADAQARYMARRG